MLTPDVIESVILILVLGCFIVVVLASVMTLIYLPKISRRLNRLENQGPPDR
ncbi:hypothetical protein [Kocuria soli]|uniref:hypothetical protein n=1 Tax=Kocuria soli TaxID=2485125 RepID=UPI00131576A9|nr:hypothetical protein [Kocuria soli]